MFKEILSKTLNSEGVYEFKYPDNNLDCLETAILRMLS